MDWREPYERAAARYDMGQARRARRAAARAARERRLGGGALACSWRATDEGAAEWLGARRLGIARAGTPARARRLGPADRRDQGAAHRGRRRARRGAVGARRRRGGGGVADRPLRRSLALLVLDRDAEAAALAAHARGRVPARTSRTLCAACGRDATGLRSGSRRQCGGRSRRGTTSSRTSRSPTPRSRSTRSRRDGDSARASPPRRGPGSRASVPLLRARGSRTSRGDGSPANARATASALSVAGDEEEQLVRAASRRGSVSVIRSTNGSWPAWTPTTSRSVTSSVGEVREERGDVAVGAEPEQHEVERPTPASSRSYSLARLRRGRARRRSGGRRRSASSRSSSAAFAIPKFERASSGGTQRSSPHQSSTRLQSGSSSAASSYARPGVEPPVRTIAAAARACAASRSATSRAAARLVDDREARRAAHSPRRARARDPSRPGSR